MSGRDLAVLQELAAGKTVLEIGTWRGRSALEMARVAEAVWCLDTFSGDKYTETLYGPQFTWPDFNRNARERDLWPKLRLLVSCWEEILPLLRLARFDFAFYEAGHDYAETLAAGRILLAGLRPDAVLAFHDYSSNFPQVIRAINDLAAEHPKRNLERRGDVLAVFVHSSP